jgi:1-acyl-sn-glycerol-3-phosphate acyltransferase
MAVVMLSRTFDDNRLIQIAVLIAWAVTGMALGSLFAALQQHPRRLLGFVPPGATGLTITLMVAASTDLPSDLLYAAFGFMVGLVNFPLSVTYQIVLPPNARANGMAIRIIIDYLVAALAAVIVFWSIYYAAVLPTTLIWLIAVVTLVVTLASWWIFRREAVEATLEVVFLVLYRIRVAGPGVDTFPMRGPVIVVANHSGYLDPMWLAKVIPRSLIPMMTSYFFDVPALRWAMVYLADAIRVEYGVFRREVPELQTAVGVLDAGKCLVIFPEGRLRRTEEQPLRLFGQGIWHILRDRPNTPVVVCWIEGGWGSFFSYYKGPPTKNKPFDIRHPIGVAVGAPHVLDKAVLADHLQTRQYLMEQCAAARTYLGLEPVKFQQVEWETTEEVT